MTAERDAAAPAGDTPGVDAAEIKNERLDGDIDVLVSADFARQLERDLAAEHEEMLFLRKKIAALMPGPCCQKWHTCTRRCWLLSEHWRTTAKVAEADLAAAAKQRKQDVAEIARLTAVLNDDEADLAALRGLANAVATSVDGKAGDVSTWENLTAALIALRAALEAK